MRACVHECVCVYARYVCVSQCVCVCVSVVRDRDTDTDTDTDDLFI